MEVDEAKIFKSHILIPYSILDVVYAFLGPFPNSSADTKQIRKKILDVKVAPLRYSQMDLTK